MRDLYDDDEADDDKDDDDVNNEVFSNFNTNANHLESLVEFRRLG